MDLKIIRANSRYFLEGCLSAIDDGDENERSCRAYFEASFYYRRLALCELLGHARVDRFYAYLYKSGLVRRHLLQLIAVGHASEPLYQCASKNFPLIDALVAGQPKLAAEIARLSTDRAEVSCEYEEDFLLFHVLHRLTLNVVEKAEFDLEGPMLRWQEVLNGKNDGYCAACRALWSRDVDALDSALYKIAEVRDQKFSTFGEGAVTEDMMATERFVAMNGLAILRLADLLDMKMKEEYPTMPRLVRTRSAGQTSLIDSESWRTIDEGVPAR